MAASTALCPRRGSLCANGWAGSFQSTGCILQVTKPHLIKESRKRLQCMAASLPYLCSYLQISEPHSLQSCLRLHCNHPKQRLLEHGATGGQIHLSPANYACITDPSMVGQEGSYLWCTRRASVMSNLLSSALPCTPPPCKRRVLPSGQQCLT